MPPIRKLRSGERARGIEEELLDARLAVGKAVAEERQVGLEGGFGRHGVMRRGVEGIVDRHAAACAERLVGRDDRRPSAIGEDEVEAREGAVERMVAILSELRQGGGRVDVPEDADRIGPGVPHHAFDQHVVVDPDAARLDHDIGVPGLRHHLGDPLVGRRIDHHFGPVGRVDVPMLLPVEGVGLVEGRAVAAGMKVPDHAAVIGGGAVPIG